MSEDVFKSSVLPQYRSVASEIDLAIERGHLEPGLVLLESQLSAVFTTSRATVRSALAFLSENGRVERFNGRGFVVPGSSEFSRREIVATDFAATVPTKRVPRPASDQIIAEVESVLSKAVAFGHYRIDEQVLADSYSVSRPVAREVLWRLRDTGLVEKDHHSPWLAGPLTARAVAEDRDLRILLEPYALKISAPGLSRQEIFGMRQRVENAKTTEGKVASQLIDIIENDLHVDCLKHFSNNRIWQVMRHGQLPLRVNSLFARFVGVERDDPTFAEHAVVLDQIFSGEYDAAAASHSAHLRQEGYRALDRLKVLSVIQEPTLPDYLERIV